MSVGTSRRAPVLPMLAEVASELPRRAWSRSSCWRLDLRAEEPATRASPSNQVPPSPPPLERQTKYARPSETHSGELAVPVVSPHSIRLLCTQSR